MIKRMIMNAGIILLLIMTHNSAMAAPGLLFNVTGTGPTLPEPITIELCLNAPGPFSCQTYMIRSLNLSINTTIPNHTYPVAGIRVLASQVRHAGNHLNCTLLKNGFCQFSVSDNKAFVIDLVETGIIEISPTNLPAGMLNNTYHQTLTASGGTAPYHFVIASGSLPPGLTLDNSTGLISGTPTTADSYDFTVKALDSNLPTRHIGSKDYTLTVLKLGDAYQGGTVACLNGGFENLIVSTHDNSPNIQWSNPNTSVPTAQNADDGATNTSAIVAATNTQPPTNVPSNAAITCAHYSIDSANNSPCLSGNTCYDDWFLPATNQLSCLYNNRAAIGNNFVLSEYWTSTENNSSTAVGIIFVGGTATFTLKGQGQVVRCVRSLS